MVWKLIPGILSSSHGNRRDPLLSHLELTSRLLITGIYVFSTARGGSARAARDTVMGVCISLGRCTTILADANEEACLRKTNSFPKSHGANNYAQRPALFNHYKIAASSF
ncbi:hypothetical protein EVAR_22743_1 [Eumeta japonica]|uniref:Uncharacterized protein n=1 Tax=Eumeta variegata TaxID=151549 RepID=A0A4C1USC5_EUMVA|nr:hypothetical protein EVAR_22743_1 [Eumeta japonica]